MQLGTGNALVSSGSQFLAALTGIMRLREGKGGLRTLAGGFWIVLFVTWMCVLLISTMAILLAQVQSISGNITTNEMSNWHRYPYMKHPRCTFHDHIPRSPVETGRLCMPSAFIHLHTDRTFRVD